jgi:LuxR family transcriptional regulator, maltose regulon positive regulatory protein
MGDGALLLTKIEPPRMRPGHVLRGDLVARLGQGLDRRLNLVAAPAGWGKTSLLAEWLAVEDEVAFAWLSLDEDDNDPARFWAYVSAALRKAGVDLPAAFEAAVAAPRTPVRDAALPLLINALVASAERHVLVLDDYQVISDPTIHDGVRFLLEHLPLTSHLVIATRVEPPVGVPRLRARGELGEIASDQLRFSRAEVAALLNDTLALALADEELTLLSARTEGWAAGLYLAGLSLRDRVDPRRTEDLAYDRHLVDYLGDEVVSAQPPRARRFLIDTCVLDRFCASLCDAVRGEDASNRLLGEIERANLFLVPLDERREWFRYHHVFRDVLRRELEDTCSDEYIAELHARAGAWFAEAADVSAAVGHLLAAGRETSAADLIATSWNASQQRGRSATIIRWLDALPVDVVTDDPRLCLARAWLALDSGEQATAERWTQAAAAADDGRPLAEGGATIASGVAMLRATLAYQNGDLIRAEELGAQAVELEDRPDSSWRAVALATLGAARHFRGAASDDVVPLLEQAVAIARSGANSIAVLRAQGTLAAATFAAGDLDEATRWVAAADQLRAQQSLEEYWMGSLATAVAGQLAAGAGDLELARERLERSVVLARRGAARPEHIYALAALAPIQATLADPDAAAATLHSARLALKGSPSPGLFPHLLNDVDRRLRGKSTSDPGAAADVDELSVREMSVLRLLGSELSIAAIGDELYISRNTVKTHLRGIYRKLDADTRAVAVARARELRLL